ncbi:TonB-linked outer membrane protein, SusC/RagA family [Chitinophaga jiangningensis]|uniref:TonB-linked outer membrane protein, SusC/RagA family n=1 Tax=Chitinophaga jiangningensis TaxID=1419482 RepID=A0A1M7C3C2_9BACT|nr:TonB-dependent receptor [Chitinophaga jiangningensis]SHL61677.1 TonB-linked outer membrane protein, SusC/RagA family [Chitinophaga jiangningensis]
MKITQPSNINITAGIIILASLLKFGSLAAQKKSAVVRGIVHDATDHPIIGATILIRQAESKAVTGATSNESGVFSATVAPGDGYTITISSIGFETQTLSRYTLKDNSTLGLDITLQPSTGSLESVVVVGYGTQKKVNLTGAVQVVKGEELINRPTPTLTQALQGKVAGMNFTPGVYGFEPGASMHIQIRGQGTPLIIVDGIAVASLDGLNPNDIANITVLKDAAASAIYGARAPYGVLLVTTRNGKQDQKMRVEYDGIFTRITPLRMPHMLDAYTTAKAYNEASNNTGISPIYTNETIDRILKYMQDPAHTPETVPNPANLALWGDVYLGNANYDWFNVFYGNGNRQQHNISLSGGNTGLTFFVSGGYTNDGGLLQIGEDNYKRYNLTSKLATKLTRWLQFSSNTRFYNSSRITPAYDNQGNYDLVFHQVARTFPSQPLKSPNGVYRVQSKIPWTKDAGTNAITINDIVQQFTVQINPVKGWSINGDYGFDITHTAYNSKNYTVYEDDVAGNPRVSGSTQNAYTEKSRNLTFYQSFNLYSSYNFSPAPGHDLSTMAGFQQELASSDYVYGAKTGLLTSSVPVMNTSTGIQYSGDSIGKYATQGIFGRFKYNYDHRYLFEFNARYDGTYKFANGKKWGFFPSASAGWNVSNEKFWKHIAPVINHLKIRGSYGSLGNQLTASPYQDVPLLDVNTNLNWIVNGTRPSYVTAPGLINPDITWEMANMADLGLDISLLKNRLTVTGDIYQRHTKNQLGPEAAVPATIGVPTLPLANNRETKTDGWEITLGWKDQIGKDFNYSLTAMVADYKSVVCKFNNPTRILTTSYNGQEIGEIWGFVSKGLIMDQKTADQINQQKTQVAISGQKWNTGDMEYMDINGDGKISNGNNTVDNPGDRRIIGNLTPRYQFGLTLNATWKGIELNLFLQGTGKRDLPVGYTGTTNMMWGFTTLNQSSIFAGHLNYYRDAPAGKYAGLGENKDAYFARPYLNAEMNAKNQVLQTRYLLNGAYARLKNLRLGYHLPAHMLERIKMQGLYVFLSGENLVTWSSLPAHLDPETATIGVRGDAKSFFPATGYSVGVNVTL